MCALEGAEKLVVAFVGRRCRREKKKEEEDEFFFPKIDRQKTITLFNNKNKTLSGQARPLLQATDALLC